MVSVRCEICRLRLPTLKKLIHHYGRAHSKLKIIKSLLKSSLLLSIPKNYPRKFRRFSKTRIFSLNYPKKETIYLNDNIHILCGRNEIIIGDEKSSVGMEFSFNEEQSDSMGDVPIHSPTEKTKDTPLKETKSKIAKNRPKKSIVGPTKTSKKAAPKKNKKIETSKCKRAQKPRHYQINITKLEERSILNEKNGDFYICTCRGKQSPDNSNGADLQIFTRNPSSSLPNIEKVSSVDPRVEMKAFCSKCFNGYKTDEELMEHMKIHEMHCRVCNEIFPTEQQFKEHTRTHMFKVYACHLCNYEYPFKQLLEKHLECHMDNEVLETVLDMEDDYKVSRHNFSLLGHHGSINSILRFLSEGHDICYYSYKYMKTICDICYHEFYVCDYEQHLQNVHFQYSFS